MHLHGVIIEQREGEAPLHGDGFLSTHPFAVTPADDMLSASIIFKTMLLYIQIIDKLKYRQINIH